MLENNEKIKKSNGNRVANCCLKGVLMKEKKIYILLLIMIVFMTLLFIRVRDLEDLVKNIEENQVRENENISIDKIALSIENMKSEFEGLRENIQTSQKYHKMMFK